ncbi:MAG: alpha/beta fold hydrolase [Myxococcota bacterium]
MQEKFIEVDGIRTAYIDEGSGTPVLFVHGLAGYKENWEYNLPAFAERYRAIALDLPGFGRTERPDVPYGIPFFAEFVLKFLRTLDIPRAHLVGNSMGGHTVSFIAATSKEVPQKIVLADPAGARPSEILGATPITPDMIEAMGPVDPGEDFVRMYANLQFFKPGERTEKMIRRAMADIAEGDLESRFNAYLKSLRGLLADDMEPRYKDITAPTLVLWGENDMIVPLSHADVIAGAIPGATKVVFKECGHIPMVEKSEDFNRAVLAFLA